MPMRWPPPSSAATSSASAPSGSTARSFPSPPIPITGYTLERLDPSGAIAGAFEWAGALARAYDVRLSLHPDQFVVLNSEREAVVRSAVQELEHPGDDRRADRRRRDRLHGGGAAGGLGQAAERLERGLELLSPRVRERLALENDDRCFTPRSLLPLCRRSGVPLVYDVHHHRCLPDQSISRGGDRAGGGDVGGREQYTSPLVTQGRMGGTEHSGSRRLHRPGDFPDVWLGRSMTVDVEAKAKERAVVAMMQSLSGAALAVTAPKRILTGLMPHPI